MQKLEGCRHRVWGGVADAERDGHGCRKKRLRKMGVKFFCY